MSGDGSVWISPPYFFEIVGAMRKRAVLPEGQTALNVPDVAHAGGTSYLEALVNSVGEARTMITANVEIAGRALLVAGTRVVDADVVEERAGTWEFLGAPYNLMDGPGEGEDYDDWEDKQEKFYTEHYDYMEETEERFGDGG